MSKLKVLIAICMAVAGFTMFGAAVDTSGNPVVLETDLGDVDMDATTVGDLKDVMTPGYNTVSNAAMNAATAAQMAAKQDKLPYSTNAIPQGAVSGLSTALGGKVSKSGDTMTGNLTINTTNPDVHLTNGPNDLGLRISNGNKYLYTEDYDFQLPRGDGTIALTKDIPDVSKKQDKLPYPTNAIPYAAISGKPTNISAFNNDVGYVTEAVVGAAATAATNYTDAVARTPHLYTVGEGATYQWSGSSAFPAGKYYRVNTGEGRLGYAAKVPVPVGQIIVTGDADDPMIAKFGSLFSVDSSNLALSSISGYVEDGCYSVADFSYEIYPGSGIKAYLHSNIIAGSAELTSVSGNYSFTFDTEDGVTHYAYFWNGWTWSSGGYTTTYQHEWYDPSSGYWDSENRTITVGYATASPTDYAFSMFGGTDIATMENIDTARSQLKERRGRYGELGDGWGYKVYDFTNDERLWELKVPRLTVAVQNQGADLSGYERYINYAAAYVSSYGRPDDAIADPFYMWPRREFLPPGYTAWIKKIVATSGKYSTDGCRKVDYRLGFLPRDPSLGEYEAPCDFGVTLLATNIAISTSGQPYLWGGIEFENTNEPGPGEHGGEVKDFSLSWKTNYYGAVYRNSATSIDVRKMTYTYGGVTYTNDIPVEVTYNLSGFKPTVTFSGYTATVNVSFSGSTVSELYYESTTGWKLWADHYYTRTFSGNISFTLKTASALDTLTEHANHVITDYNQHMIWDDGLKCTWQLCVTNGVFSVRKVSDLDYREKEFIE